MAAFLVALLFVFQNFAGEKHSVGWQTIVAACGILLFEVRSTCLHLRRLRNSPF